MVFELNAKTILFGTNFDKSLDCNSVSKVLLYKSKINVYMLCRLKRHLFSLLKKDYGIQKYEASVNNHINSFNDEW